MGQIGGFWTLWAMRVVRDRRLTKWRKSRHCRALLDDQAGGRQFWRALVYEPRFAAGCRHDPVLKNATQVESAARPDTSQPGER